MLQWTFAWQSSYRLTFLFLLSKHLEVELLSHTVTLYIKFWGPARLFSKVATPLYSHLFFVSPPCWRNSVPPRQKCSTIEPHPQRWLILIFFFFFFFVFVARVHFGNGVWWIICLGRQTVILPISASQVVRIIGVSPQSPAYFNFFILVILAYVK
jgi:hypothetical protein